MSDRNRDAQRRLEARLFGLGATGEYPHGSLGADDEGELRAGVGIEDGKVIINFGKPVAWLSITPAGARELAAMLIAKADIAEKPT